jgi:hypothetical protein
VACLLQSNRQRQEGLEIPTRAIGEQGDAHN